MNEGGLALTKTLAEVSVPSKMEPNEAFKDSRDGRMLRTAKFSSCRTFRYSLSRIWTPQLPKILFVGLNPSTADETEDDPTVRRCIGFARKWNYGGLVLVNLFAYRSTDPGALVYADDPIGPANDRHILKSANATARIVLAWGTKGSILGRDQRVLSLLPGAYCLGLTNDGHPKHPLYLAGSTRLRTFSVSRAAA